jgi:hypothetical protein
MPTTKRDSIFQLRMSEEERRMLQVIADEDGLTASDIVRQFIRAEWWRRYGKGIGEFAKRATK